MRHKFCLPFLLVALGCDGRYILGNMHETGDAGTPDGGAPGSGGSGGNNSGTGGNSGSGDAGAVEAGESSTGLVLSPPTVPNASLSVSYFVTFGAHGGVPGYTFHLLSGALPTGLTLDANGQLSGIPQEQGTFSFVVEVTDAANTKASASYQIAVARTHWLASETFVSTVSTQTALSLIDLEHPQADPVLIENQSTIAARFSADGRWVLYSSYRSVNQYDIYLVNAVGEKPSKRQFLLTAPTWWACRWAPDSSKVACFKDAGSPDAPVRQVVYFDTSQAVVGPELLVGTVPPLSAGATGLSERELAFLDGNTVVYSYGPNDFARVEWHGQTLSAPQLLGLGGGTFSKLADATTPQSPDGGRMLVKRTDPNYPLGSALVDFRLGQAEVIDPAPFTLSDSFEAGLSNDPPADADAGLGTYSYYSVTGIHVERVGQEPAEQSTTYASHPQIAGRTVARLRGNQVVVITVGKTSTVEHVVAGEYQGVISIRIDPNENWLYIGTADLDNQNQPIEATTKHWLSRLQADGPAPAQLIGQGYSVGTQGKVLFSPNSRGLVLHGYDPYDQRSVPVAFRLFDLTDSANVKAYQLDLPLTWADTDWSPDSTYVSFIGGSSDAQHRPLFVVDALAPSATPRLIIQCGPGNPSGPTCPNVATFQP